MEPEPSPEPSPESEPKPHDDEIDAAALFALLCAPCHGTDFRGSAGGIDLTERLPTISDDRAFQSIQHGVPPEMPAWSGTVSVEETRALIAYLRAEIE